MTLDDIIRRAYRLAGYLKFDDEPTPSEFANALQTLQGVYYELIVRYAPMSAVRISADYTAGENERVFNSDDTPYSITLPETISDTSATDGLRPPKNGAVVEIAGATPQIHVYVAHFGAWQQLQALTTSDEQPLGPAHDQDIAALLAVRLAPEIPSQLPPTTVPLAEEGKRSIRARFRQSRAVQIDPVLTRSYRFDMRL